MSQMLNNRYLIIQQLGSGGFGDTFIAEDVQIPSRRKCVIKLLKAVTQNPQLSQLIQQRFQREAALLEDLGRHSQIPTLYAYFQEASQFYLVQELIEGKTLSNKIAQEGLMNENAVRDFLKNILPVLNFVHNKRIVHRDIKPDNIIVRYSDGMPVLIDFGAVKESLGTVVNSQGQAASSIVIGTPGFMPSEQAAGRPVFSSDLYSIALTAIYLLTGKMPQELDVDPRNGEILWRQYAPHVTPVLAGVLDRAIQSHARERFASAREMLDALQSGNIYPASPSVGDVPPTVIGTQQANSVPPPNYNAQPSYQVPPTVVPTPQPQGYQQPGYPTPQPQGYQQPGYPTPQPQGYQQPGYPVNQYQQSGLVGGGGTFNTSAPVPAEIQGWNWGAFLMSGLWCLPNQVWIGLLSWIPYVGIPMPFILGAKGNVWAWRSRQWRSVEQFKAHQRGWAIAGIITWSSLFAIFIILAAIGSQDGKNNNSGSSNVSTTENSSPTPQASISPNPSISGDRETLPVEIGQLEAYRYKTGLFSLDIPQGWTLKEQSTSQQIFVGWQDKNENGAIFVIVGQNAEKLTDEGLGNKLKDYINSSFNTDGLKVESTDLPVKQPNGSVRVSFALRDKSLNVLLTGNGFIEQENNKLSYFLVFVPQSQYSKLLPSINMVIASYTLYGAAPLK
ncbi:serine/threonine-protein kinase [Merismopedia glauca]|uniref:non-specific serine/threonine protein kinase n=1 Tax=Merismopedia glauca CCAP 1448/3 TaxID=1296344 RepID=A0A2T1C453_9CYAN|nr:serine/threonine-protein kinase [Merismopedia glauca]PSB03060.1 serine/threonine protein kinase [Merismopedia glauca CCAP 1448/3]